MSFPGDLLKAYMVDNHVRWQYVLVQHFCIQRLQISQHVSPAAFRCLQEFDELKEQLSVLYKPSVDTTDNCAF